MPTMTTSTTACVEYSAECVLVGDEAIGKTCLVLSYCTNKFPLEHVPVAQSVLGMNYCPTVMCDGGRCRIRLLDVRGTDEYERLRPLCYPRTDVFLMCFSVVDPTSFENITEKWIPEVQSHCPNTPFILVGTKTDLREDDATIENLSKNDQTPISQEDGVRLAKELEAVKYLECSALTMVGLKHVVDETTRVALLPLRKVKKRCNIM